MGNNPDPGGGFDTRANQTAFIRSFDPEPYEVIQPLHLDVRPHRGEVMASFLPVGLSAAGPDEAAAVANLKERILDLFDHLASRPPAKLDPAGAGRLAVLREYIRKTPR